MNRHRVDLIRAADGWRRGMGTLEIARHLQLREFDVYNVLDEIKVVAAMTSTR